MSAPEVATPPSASVIPNGSAEIEQESGVSEKPLAQPDYQEQGKPVVEAKVHSAEMDNEGGKEEEEDEEVDSGEPVGNEANLAGAEKVEPSDRQDQDSEKAEVVDQFPTDDEKSSACVDENSAVPIEENLADPSEENLADPSEENLADPSEENADPTEESADPAEESADPAEEKPVDAAEEKPVDAAEEKPADAVEEKAADTVEEKEEARAEDETAASGDGGDERMEEDDSADAGVAAIPARHSKSHRKSSAKKESPPKPEEEPEQREGKRRRSAVQRFSADSYSVAAKEIAIPEGPGTKLGDIPYIDAMISKTQVEDLKKLHSLMFARVGQSKDVRTNVKKFCGFEFTKDSAEYKKKRRSMDQGWVLKYLRTICDVLGLDKPHRKEELIDAILNFLMSPMDSGKKVPTKGSKRKKAPEKKTTERKSRTPRKKKASDTSGSGEDDDDGDEEADEEEVSPPKKRKPNTSDEGSAKRRRGRPLVNQGKASPKKPPSNNELTKVIKDLLKGVNLEEVTMKEMCKKVFDKFPGVDVTSKKDFIKNTVKSIISASE